MTYELRCHIDWDDDGDFLDPYEDVSAALDRASIKRGRGAVTDQFAAGQASITLENPAGIYSPYNVASPIYGLMLPGRAVRLEAVIDAVTIPVFFGYITDYRQSHVAAGLPGVDISLVDGFDRLRLGQVRLAAQANKRVDELLGAVLDAAGWPAGLRDLDQALTTVERFWVHRQSPLAALQLAAKQELGGSLFMDAAGAVRFQNRDYRSTRPLYTTLTGPQALALELRRDQLFDAVHHQWAGLSADASNTVLFTLSPARRKLMPGTSDPLNTIHGDFSTGAASMVTPLGVTDYTANSQPDGSGIDKTNQVLVNSFTSYGGGFSAAFENLDSSPVYLTFLQVRGIAVRVASDERMIEIPVASPILTGQVMRDDFAFNNEPEAVAAYAHWRSWVFSQIRPRPVVSLAAFDDAERALILGAQLSDRIRVVNTSGMYPTQLDAEFFIEGIQITFGEDEAVACQWQLFDASQAMGNFWRISSDDTSAEYSVISADAATDGDRVAV